MMIKSTFTILAMSAGLGGAMALSPAETHPPKAPAPEVVPEPDSAPVPQADAAPPEAPSPAAIGHSDAPPVASPRADWRKKFEHIQQELQALKAAYESAESTYERNAIKRRANELKQALAELKAAAEHRAERAGSRGPAAGVGRTAPRAEWAEQIKAEYGAMMRRADELETQGEIEKASAIRKRLEESRARIMERTRDSERSRISEVPPAPPAPIEGQIRAELEAMADHARELARQGRHAEAEEILGRLNGMRARADRRRESLIQRQGRVGEARQKAEELMHKANEFELRGDVAASNALRRQAREILTRIERTTAERGAAARRAPLPPGPRGGIVREGRPERADRPEPPRRGERPPEGLPRRAAPPMADAPPAPGPVAEFQTRIEHMAMAAKSLEAAGFPDQAAKLRDQIAKMKDTARRTIAERRHAVPSHRVQNEVEALRRDVEELRQIVRELAARVEAYHADRE